MGMRIALFSCAFCLVAVAQVINQPPPKPVVYQKLIPLDGFPLQQFGFQNWLDTIEPETVVVTEPYSQPETINIASDKGSCDGFCSIPGTILAPTIPISTATDNNGFTHEFILQGFPPSSIGDTGLTEGIASAQVDALELALFERNPTLFPNTQPSITLAPSIDMWNTLRLTVFGGAGFPGQSNFYGNADNSFESPTSLVALFVNKLGSYRILDHLLNTAQPHTREAFLALVDSLGITIDGVEPSTFFRRDVTNFAGAPNGRYFGIVSEGGYDPKYQEPTRGGEYWPLNPFGYTPFIVEFATSPLIGQLPTVLHGWVRWTVTDANGKVIATQTVKDIDGIQFQGNPVIDPDTNNPKGDWGWYAHYPTGAYKVDAEYLDGTKAGESNPWYTDTAYFAIVNEELSPCDVAVSMNGPRWGELTANRPVTLLSATNSINIENYPGLVIFDSSEEFVGHSRLWQLGK